MSPEDSANGNETVELPLFTPRRLVQTAVVVLALLVGIYFLFPKLVGLGDAQLLAQCEVDTYRASGPGGQK